MFCNKWIKKNLIIGSIVLSSNNLINGCSNIGKVDNLAKALYDHCVKNKDLKLGQTTFTKENAKNFAEIFGQMVRLTEYLDPDDTLMWKFTDDGKRKVEALNIATPLLTKLKDNFIVKLGIVISTIQQYMSKSGGASDTTE